jgi:hypothetical protein
MTARPQAAAELARAERAAQAAPARKIAMATAAALLVAAAVLVVAVLPAEYGIDPLGTGRLLGLTGLADTAPAAITPQASSYRTDSVEFVLGPYESLEYKYRIEKDASMLFSWRATGEVIYDFHSEPDGAAEGYAESFDRQTRAEGHGTYAAPFGGVHGWYWENPGRETVTITLVTAGFYTNPREYFDGREFPRELKEPLRR